MKNVKRIVSIVLLLALVLTLLPMGVLAADAKETATCKAVGPVIISQPTSKTFNEESLASYTVKVKGSGWRYQWYYRESSSHSWKKCWGSYANKSTFKITATKERIGKQYRCRVYCPTCHSYKDSNYVTMRVNLTKFRALVIGQSYANNYQPTLVSCPKDATRMQNLLNSVYGFRDRSWTVTKRTDVTYSGLTSAINTAFSGADDNDVSLFYYSGHGGNGGTLCTCDSGYGLTVYPSELASMLGKVKGKVIVIIDACHSGGVIGKDAGSAAKAADSFNSAVVQAFAAQNSAIQSFDNGLTAKSGALTQSKFLVLTACNSSQYSWCNNNYGYFTYYVDLGGRGYADADGNKRVSLNELYNYVYSRASGPYYDGSSYNYQYAQVYPANSYYTLFKLK